MKVWHNCTSWYRAPVEEDDKVGIAGRQTQRKGDILALWPSSVRMWLEMLLI